MLKISKLNLGILVVRLRLFLLQQFNEMKDIQFKISHDIRTECKDIYLDENFLYELVLLYGNKLQQQKYVCEQMNIDFGTGITIQITDAEIAYVLEEKFFFDKTYKMPAIRIILSNNMEEITYHSSIRVKKTLPPRPDFRLMSEMLDNPEDFMDRYYGVSENLNPYESVSYSYILPNDLNSLPESVLAFDHPADSKTYFSR